MSIESILTIIGWLVTAILQLIILWRTRVSQNLDRELAVFRERIATVRNITSSLIDQGDTYAKLAAHFLGKSPDISEAAEILKKAPNITEITKILVDPEFQSIQNLLPHPNSEKLYNQLVEISTSGQDFHTRAIGLNQLNPEINNLLAGELLKLAGLYTDTARMFAEEYAILDQKLARGK